MAKGKAKAEALLVPEGMLNAHPLAIGKDPLPGRKRLGGRIGDEKPGMFGIGFVFTSSPGQYTSSIEFRILFEKD